MAATAMGTLSPQRFVTPHMQQQPLHHPHHVQQHSVHGLQWAQPQPQQQQQQQQPPGTPVATSGSKVNQSWVRSPPGATSTPNAGAKSGPAANGQATPGMDALHREVDALRHTIKMQEQRISDLNVELQSSKDSGIQLSSEVESARSELSGLIQELQMERAERQRAETVMAEQQQAMLSLPAGRRGSRDEVEPRLREFIEKSKCNLIFRQLNRGWYAFRRADEKGPQSNDRHVAISIINGKLMVTLEPSTHDPGWNFGKPGPIEKFVAKHAEE